MSNLMSLAKPKPIWRPTVTTVLLQEGVKVSIRNIILYWILEQLFYPLCSPVRTEGRSEGSRTSLYYCWKGRRPLCACGANTLVHSNDPFWFKTRSDFSWDSELTHTDCALCSSKVLTLQSPLPSSQARLWAQRPPSRIEKAGALGSRSHPGPN